MEDEHVGSDNVVITRRVLLVAGLVLALAFTLLIGSGVWLSWRLGNAVKANRELALSVKELITPTPKQYRKQLTVGFRRCAKEPLCVKALHELLRDPVPRANGARNGSNPRLGSAPGSDGLSTETDEGRGAPSDRSHPARPPVRSPEVPPPPPSSPPPAAPAPPGNGEGPPVQVQVPGGPQLCGNSLVSVNC